MPPASLFHAGNVCGAVETCFTFAWRKCSYALSMSDTTMAMCRNQWSKLRESDGMGCPCS